MNGRPKTTKFRSQRQELDGRTFASKAEAKRYGELQIMAAAGTITDLRCQPRYPIYVRDTLICHYVGDFEYSEADGRIVEDVKGFPTPEFKLKEKLFRACYPNLELRVITKSRK